MAAYHFPTFDIRLNVFNLTDENSTTISRLGRRPRRSGQWSYRDVDPEQALLGSRCRKYAGRDLLDCAGDVQS